jgi:DNA invertase Pin-like site-specific DNA recombinase
VVKPVGVYLRVSGEDQDHASQRAEAMKWLHGRGIDPGKVVWYVDVMSGRKTSRKDYDRLKRDATAGRIKQVVVFSLDRLGRDMIEGMELVAAWCRAGVGIASITQPVDISGGPIGLAIAVLLFAFAEIGWAQRRDAQRAGIELAKAAGVYKGRKPGATAGGAKAGKPDRAREMRAKGLTAPEIGQALGVSERTVWRYIGAPQD